MHGRHRVHLYRCRVSPAFTASQLPAPSYRLIAPLCRCIAHTQSLTSSYGTAKSGVGISAMAVLRPDLMMKCTVPVIMAGIIAIVSVNWHPFFVPSVDPSLR